MNTQNARCKKIIVKSGQKREWSNVRAFRMLNCPDIEDSALLSAIVHIRSVNRYSGSEFVEPDAPGEFARFVPLDRRMPFTGWRFFLPPAPRCELPRERMLTETNSGYRVARGSKA
jgi:hypothetical protein